MFALVLVASGLLADEPVSTEHYSLAAREGLNLWSIKCIWQDVQPFDFLVSISKNGTTLKQYGRNSDEYNDRAPSKTWMPRGNYFQVIRPKVRAPFPVFVISGHSGFGAHEDRIFYALVSGRLVILGRPPASNANGPINWRGKSDHWIFDDFDYYNDLHGLEPLRHVLYRVTESGFQRLSSWRVRKGLRIRDTVGIKW